MKIPFLHKVHNKMHPGRGSEDPTPIARAAERLHRSAEELQRASEALLRNYAQNHRPHQEGPQP